MSHPNEDLIRRFFAGYGDRSAVLAVFAPEAVWREPGGSPISGEYVGPEAIADLIDDILERSDGTFRIVEVVDVVANDHNGLALVRVEGVHGTCSIITTDRVVFAFRKGRIIDVRVLSEDQGQVDEFWA